MLCRNRYCHLIQLMFHDLGPVYKEDLMFRPTMTVHVKDPDDFEKVFRAEGKYPRRLILFRFFCRAPQTKESLARHNSSVSNNVLFAWKELKFVFHQNLLHACHRWSESAQFSSFHFMYGLTPINIHSLFAYWKNEIILSAVCGWSRIF